MATPVRVLVVDDVEEIGQMFARFAHRIRKGAVEVFVESDPLHARARIEREDFGAIISDYRMPELDGLELLAAARAMRPGARRVLITGYVDLPSDAAKLAAAHVDAHLQKPISASDAMRLIECATSPDAHAMDAYRAQARRLEEAAAERERSPL